MKSFVFDSEIAKLRLFQRAEMWYGAKFHLRACIPFEATDCIQLALDLYHHSHFQPAVKIPETYRADWGIDEGDELIENEIRKSGDFQEIFPQKLPDVSKVKRCWSESGRVVEYDFKPGDIIIFKTARTAHHCGIMTGYCHFIHAMKRHGVIRSSVSDGTYNKRIKSVWRPVE